MSVCLFRRTDTKNLRFVEVSEGHRSKREVENMKPQDNGKARIKGRLRFAFSMLFLQRLVVLQGLENVD